MSTVLSYKYELLKKGGRRFKENFIKHNILFHFTKPICSLLSDGVRGIVASRLNAVEVVKVLQLRGHVSQYPPPPHLLFVIGVRTVDRRPKPISRHLRRQWQLLGRPHPVASDAIPSADTRSGPVEGVGALVIPNLLILGFQFVKQCFLTFRNAGGILSTGTKLY